MKTKFKFIWGIFMVAVLFTACNEDENDLQDVAKTENISSNAVSEAITEIPIKELNAVNTDNRGILAQLFEGDEFDGRSQTISTPLGARSINMSNIRVTFNVRSIAVAAGVRISGFSSFDNRNLAFGNTRGPVYERRAIPDDIGISDGFEDGEFPYFRTNDRLSLTRDVNITNLFSYVGQLFSFAANNRASRIPLWGNASTNLADPDLRPIFNDRLGFFIPASRSQYTNIQFREDSSFRSRVVLTQAVGSSRLPNRRFRRLGLRISSVTTFN